VPATEDIRAALGTTWFELRGELLWKLSESVDAAKLAQIAKDPEVVSRFASSINDQEDE
jgi:hypothetical protein